MDIIVQEQYYKAVVKSATTAILFLTLMVRYNSPTQSAKEIIKERKKRSKSELIIK